MSGCGARTAAGSLDAVFRVVGCRAFRLDFDGGLGGEAEEMSLLNPLMRQVLAQSQEPRRRQLDWLTALEERAHDVRSQMGQSNKRSEAALAYSEAFGHCLDAVVRPRQKPVPNRFSASQYCLRQPNSMLRLMLCWRATPVTVSPSTKGRGETQWLRSCAGDR